MGFIKGENESAISCCDQCQDCGSPHPQCFPILVEKSDPFYSDKGVRCLDFVRSAPAPQCAISKIPNKLRSRQFAIEISYFATCR
jgi:hypothetical protein